MAISIDSWKVALEHAESLVNLAEKKLERQKISCAVKMVKLQVCARLSCFTLLSSANPFIIPSQAQNDRLKLNEEAAHESLRQNNLMIRKVIRGRYCNPYL